MLMSYCFVIDKIIADDIDWKLLVPQDDTTIDHEQEDIIYGTKEQIIDGSYAYIDSNPVAVHLITMGTNYQLKVSHSLLK